jgi:pyridoxine 4-dehydrogenase
MTPTTAAATPPAAAAGTLLIGGDLPVHRLGFGAMRLTGPGVWGPPADRKAAQRVLRRALELGVNFIDTADSYGPGVSEEIIAEALHPYPPGLVIATKGGLTRAGSSQWGRDARPAHLRAACEGSLQRLRLERIDLYQLHAVDARVPLEESLAELARLRTEGKIRHIGVSNVSAEELVRAQRVVDVVSVQNRYNRVDRGSEDVLHSCERASIAFIPWFPLGAGRDAAHAQGAIAWLLARSPVMLPIPGTSSIAHLEENVAAAAQRLSAAELDAG